MTLQNLFFLLDKPLEVIINIIRCLSTNTDKGSQSTSNLFRSEQGSIAFDNAFSFHALNTRIDGGATQVGFLADGGVSYAPVLEQQIQNLQINVIKGHIFLISRQKHKFIYIS